MPIARDALNGSSDGRVISLPEATLLLGLASRSLSGAEVARTLRWTIEFVIRVLTGPPSRSG